MKYRPKRCEYNKDEDKNPKTLNDKNVSFRMIILSKILQERLVKARDLQLVGFMLLFFFYHRDGCCLLS